MTDNQFSITINFHRVLITKKLPHLKQNGMDFFDVAALPYNVEASDPELVLLGGLQEALAILKRRRVKNANLTIRVPSHEIAEALSNPEGAKPEFKGLWRTFSRNISDAGHVVSAIEVDQQHADMMTENLVVIEEKPATDNEDEFANEIWRWIPDLEGRYQASSHGRIKSFCQTGPKSEGRIMTQYSKLRPRMADGTCKADLFVNIYLEPGVLKPCKVQHLAMAAFAGPKSEGYHVCHYDDESTHNHMSNIRYDTPAMNALDRSFNSPRKAYTVERLQPNQRALYWDHWSEKFVTMYG